MTRIILCTALAWLAAASVPVAAQDQALRARLTTARDAIGRAPRILPGTRADAFATIQGNALSPTDRALPDTLVRLRDARGGRIVDWQLTDGAGLFAFRSIDPGSYIVEIMGPDDASVLAASQLLTAEAGQVVSTIVKLPFGTPSFAGILGNSNPSAAAVNSQAASSGVLAAQISGAATCDNLQ
jgi:hypothetical protein